MYRCRISQPPYGNNLAHKVEVRWAEQWTIREKMCLSHNFAICFHAHGKVTAGETLTTSTLDSSRPHSVRGGSMDNTSHLGLGMRNVPGSAINLICFASITSFYSASKSLMSIQSKPAPSPESTEGKVNVQRGAEVCLTLTVSELQIQDICLLKL